MPLPQLFYMEVGLSCQWVAGPCINPYGPNLYMIDGWVIMWLLIALIGVFTCVRWGVLLLWLLVRPPYRSPEERVVAEFRKRAHRASANYMDPYL